jgi:WD40 repeat protein
VWPIVTPLVTHSSEHIRATLRGHSRAVASVAFGPDGRTLATSSMDGTVELWDVAIPPPAAAIDKICQRVNRKLTTEERTMYLPPEQSSTAVCR